MVNEYLSSQNIGINELIEEYHSLAKDKRATFATKEKVLARLIEWQKAETKGSQETSSHQLPGHSKPVLLPTRDTEPKLIEAVIVESKAVNDD